ncbi:hypothetical protein PUNSTDRAFT_146831 [Punctularia strigosozonata HHB-11173 SS5]|uniref:C2H2-type domain-containing protein n=1 Tax=Punctularia strigosozonata (strain HHB-11173) TaxID=741275 RepID=R7S0W4_PUNST|nr:uncharacterized protein PUNSTDRAFT_146831 [Punctularia strigosozonata HHB-11173 SS5]EIN03853.1 hypothetical protein PUNSTDRAFT_146831 [Punctularia strigosozonata HHB-11173 SS5]
MQPSTPSLSFLSLVAMCAHTQSHMSGGLYEPVVTTPNEELECIVRFLAARNPVGAEPARVMAVPLGQDGGTVPGSGNQFFAGTWLQTGAEMRDSVFTHRSAFLPAFHEKHVEPDRSNRLLDTIQDKEYDPASTASSPHSFAQVNNSSLHPGYATAQNGIALWPGNVGARLNEPETAEGSSGDSEDFSSFTTFYDPLQIPRSRSSRSALVAHAANSGPNNDPVGGEGPDQYIDPQLLGPGRNDAIVSSSQLMTINGPGPPLAAAYVEAELDATLGPPGSSSFGIAAMIENGGGSPSDPAGVRGGPNQVIVASFKKLCLRRAAASYPNPFQRADKKHICPVCAEKGVERAYSRKKEYYRHYRDHHTGSSRLHCPVAGCKKTFLPGRLYLRAKHVNDVHGDALSVLSSETDCTVFSFLSSQMDG